MSEYKPTRRMESSDIPDNYSYQPAADFAGPQRLNKTEVLNPMAEAGLFAWLVIVEGVRAGQTFQLRGDVTTIGRDGATCDVVLDDTSISKQHARIKLEADADKNKPKEFILYDLASENKTYVAGEPILRHQLKDGDRIKIGRTTLVFKRV
jgi:pSer/pThr/pTyr-binding forkhead associated (FHA) protein